MKAKKAYYASRRYAKKRNGITAAQRVAFNHVCAETRSENSNYTSENWDGWKLDHECILRLCLNLVEYFWFHPVSGTIGSEIDGPARLSIRLISFENRKLVGWTDHYLWGPEKQAVRIATGAETLAFWNGVRKILSRYPSYGLQLRKCNCPDCQRTHGVKGSLEIRTPRTEHDLFLVSSCFSGRKCPK